MVRSVQGMSETETNKFKLNFTSSAASAPFQMGKFSSKIKLLLDGARACVVVISRTGAYGISRDYDNVINFAIKDFNSNIFASRANRRRRRRTETTHNLHGVLPIQIVWCCTLRHRHQPHHTTMYLLRVSICLDRLPFCLFLLLPMSRSYFIILRIQFNLVCRTHSVAMMTKTNMCR